MNASRWSRRTLTYLGPIVALCLTVATADGLYAEPSWPDFRGPTTQGHVTDADLPTTWSESENIAWKTPIPHRGWSSPVVQGDQIWLTTATKEGHELFALCVDLESGELLHEIRVFEEPEPQRINRLNSHASPSPVIEPGRVYVHFGSYGTAAIDTETAEIIWERRDLRIDHHEGAGSSPILHDDLLIFHCDGRDDQYVVALDKNTGETAWKTERSIDLSQLGENQRKAFATPVVVEVADELQLISQGAYGLYSYDPATGEELWRFRHDGWSNVPRPVVGDGIVYISTGYPVAELLAIRLDSSRGDLTDTHLVWRTDRQVPRRPSFILVDDLLYTVSDSGIAQAIEADTGETVWRERFGGNYSTSPLYDGEHIYFFNQLGEAIVFEPGRSYRPVSRNQLDAAFMASPAVAEDALILRTETHLYRVEK